MYQGEVNVAQEDLNTFLAVAEDLKVKGLTQNDSEKRQTKATKTADKVNTKESLKQLNQPLAPPRQVERSKAVASVQHHNHIQAPVEEVDFIKSEPFAVQVEDPYTSSRGLSGEEGTVGNPDMEYGEGYGDYVEGYTCTGQETFQHAFANSGKETKDFQTMISSVLEYDRMDRVWRCTECGKTNTDKARVRRHAEIHFQGFIHSCPHCGCQKKTSTRLPKTYSKLTPN